MGKIISRLLTMASGQAADDDLIPIQDVSVPKTKTINIGELKKVMRGNITESVDANGWTVRDNGVWKEYSRKYTWTGSVNVPVNDVTALPSLALPVGITNRGQLVASYSARCNDRVWVVNERLSDTATNFAFEVNNWYSAVINLNRVIIDIRAIETNV